MSQLVIRRTKALWQDRSRDYRVLVDGQEFARVANDSTVSVPVSPGNHSIRVQIDWGQSPKVVAQVSAGESLQLECGPNAQPLLLLLYLTIKRKNYLWLRSARGH